MNLQKDDHFFLSPELSFTVYHMLRYVQSNPVNTDAVKGL